MIGRLIQKQYVCVSVDQFAQTYLRLLPTAQDTDLTLNVFCGQTAFCQDVVNEVWDMSKWTTKVF